jgi:hypothetical protein
VLSPAQCYDAGIARALPHCPPVPQQDCSATAGRR